MAPGPLPHDHHFPQECVMLQPLTLDDAFKGYTHDLDKLLPPAETIARVRRRLAQVKLDILQETLRIDSGRLDIPVYISLLGVDAQRVVPTKKQMGKGATPVQAEASALTTRSNLYAADMQLASQSFAAGNQSQVRAILGRYAAPPRGPDRATPGRE